MEGLTRTAKVESYETSGVNILFLLSNVMTCVDFSGVGRELQDLHFLW